MEEQQQFSVEESFDSQAAPQTLEGDESTETQPEQNQDTDALDLEGEGQEAQAPENQPPALPEKLAPYQKLLESRKWDINNPDTIPEVLKSYTELESTFGKTQTEHKHTQSRAELLASIARSGIPEINKFREKEGLPPLPAAPPLEDRIKETQTLVDSLNKVLGGADADGSAFKFLNEHFGKVLGDLDFEKRFQERNPGKSQNEVFAQRKADAQSRYADAVAVNPSIKENIDALTPHFSPGGLFYGMGLDVLDVAASKERLDAFSEIGNALNLAKNFEKILADKVKEELTRRRTASNKGANGTAGRNIPNNSDRFDPLGIFVR